MEEVMRGRTVAITGANTGIGLAAALDLAGMGARVLLLCRDPGRAEAAREQIVAQTGNDAVEVVQVDLASLRSVAAAAREIRQRFDALHVLINNAAVVVQERQLTEDGLELTLAVDHVAHHLLTTALLPLMKRSAPARVITVTSAAHRMGVLDLEDPNFERRPYGGARRVPYRQSKLANLLFTYELARRLEGSGVTSNAMHPGIVATDIFRHAPWWARPFTGLVQLLGREPAKGAETITWLASAEEVAGVSGAYFVDKAARDSSPRSRDQELAGELWAWTEAQVAPHRDG